MSISLETLAAAKQFTEAYVEQHGGGSGQAVPSYLGTIALGLNWSGGGPYTQAAAANGYIVTENTKVDLIQSTELFRQMSADRVDQIYISNENGVLTAYALGGRPTKALTIQALFTEVN